MGFGGRSVVSVRMRDVEVELKEQSSGPQYFQKPARNSAACMGKKVGCGWCTFGGVSGWKPIELVRQPAGILACPRGAIVTGMPHHMPEFEMTDVSEFTGPGPRVPLHLARELSASAEPRLTEAY